MIPLTRLNGQSLLVNSDLIKVIENTPDTVISLVNGEKIVVRESRDQIVESVVQFRRRVLDGIPTNAGGCSAVKPSTPEPASPTAPAREEL